MYEIFYTAQAQKDALKIKRAGLKERSQKLIEILQNTPLAAPPSYEKLQGDLKGFYSRRINKQHRLVYEVLEQKRIVKIARMWTHYE